jgi:hypothetical protein
MAMMTPATEGSAGTAHLSHEECAIWACAAATRAIGTRNVEQDT